MPQIELVDVRRTFASDGVIHDVLHGIHMTVDPGEFVAVVGPSGSGKSSLLNLIGGLDRATSGQVRVDGLDLGQADAATLDAHRRERVGFVFQSFHLNARRTAAENVMIPLVFAPLAGSDDRARALERLQWVGLGDLADRPTATLSGGQRQRVAIARALVRSPRILLADEPVGDLDDATGQEIVRLLERINREMGVTIVAVSHDVLLIEAASRTLRMRDGALEQAPP